MSQTSVRQTVSGRQLRKKKTDRSTYIVIGVIAGVIALAAIGLAAWSFSRPPVQHFAEVGGGQGNHIQNVTDALPEPYNSNPPTSGWHWGGGAADPGVKDQMIPDTVTVHNLEHGFVVIHYRSDLDAATVDKLKNLTGQLQQQNPCIILQPRPVDKLDVPISVASWTYLLNLNGYDEGAIRTFFADHVGKDNPEKICPVGV